MSTKSQNPIIAFRVNNAELELIRNEAISRNYSTGKTAKIVLLETLSAFDRKEEFVQRRLDGIDEKLMLLRDICLLGVASAALPLGIEKCSPQEQEELRKKLQSHFKDSSLFGKNLLKMIEDGKL